MEKSKKHLKIILGILITIVFLWYSLKDVSLKEVLNEIGNANHSVLPGIAVLLFFFFWIKFFRWKHLLSPLGNFSVTDLAPSMMIGFLGNNILPLRLGEVIRIIVLCKQFNLSKSAALSTLVLERILDVLALLFLLAAGIIFSPSLPSWCQSMALGMGAISLALLILMIIFTIKAETFVSFFKNNFTFLPEKLHHTLSHAIEKSAHGLHSLKNFRLLALNMFLSILDWAIAACVLYLSLAAFDINLPISASFVVNGIIAFGVAIPSSPGFFGVVEALFSKALSLYHIPQVEAISAAIYYHLANYIPVNIVGFYYLNRLGFNLTQVSEEAEEEAHTDDPAQTKRP